LIHPTVSPQYTNVTDRQTGQDNGPIAYDGPFYKWLPKNGWGKPQISPNCHQPAVSRKHVTSEQLNISTKEPRCFFYDKCIKELC